MKLMVLLSFAICLFVNSGGNPVALENMRTENDTIPIAKFDPMLALPSGKYQSLSHFQSSKVKL